MANLFDIDCEHDVLIDFLDELRERVITIETIVIPLDSEIADNNNLLPLIGEINTIKNNAAETQNIPLSSALDSLESILSGITEKHVNLTNRFSEFILGILEIAIEMATQAAETSKVDFDLFSKIQNSLQPMSTCSAEDFDSVLELSNTLLKDYGTSSTEGIDLFDDDSSDIDLFANDVEPVNCNNNPIFEPEYSNRLKDDLQAFRLMAEEANENNSESRIKTLILLYVAKLMNAVAHNPVDSFQMEGAVYLSEMGALFENKSKYSFSNIELIPTAAGWELASAIAVFSNVEKLESVSMEKSLGNQIRNGSQILKICKKFYQSINGDLSIESIENGKKRVFEAGYSSYWTDIFLNNVDKALNCLPKNLSSENTVSSKKILCVDDDVITLKIFKHILEKANHTPILASSYDEAVELVHKSKPDLILLDMNMPEKGGYWLIENKKSDPAFDNIPIAIISGSSDDFDIPANEVIGFFKKPISKDTLIKIIEIAFS